MKNFRILPLLRITLCLVLTSSASAGDSLVFGIAPTMGPLEMERTFGRLVRVMDEGLPQDVVFRTRTSRLSFNSAFNNNEFDIVLLHPFDFLHSPVQGNYLPVVRKAGELKPVFVTIDKNIQSLQDLRGKNIAFPPASGFVVRLGKQKLLSVGLNENDYQQIIHGDFFSCLQSLHNQTADACLSIRNIVREYTRDNSLAFNVIAETESVPHIILVIHKKLEPQRDDISRLLLALNDTEQGRILLNFLLLDKLESLSQDDLNAIRSHPFFDSSR
jgi:ABC-type phosphate/phosphonate transport system substrate-binding protein